MGLLGSIEQITVDMKKMSLVLVGQMPYSLDEIAGEDRFAVLY